MRLRLGALLLASCLALLPVGCVDGPTDDGSNPGDEIDCTGLTCDWATVAGNPIFGPTWHQGDLGVDLSSPGPITIELRDVLFESQHERQLTLRTVIVRDTTATMSFELDFYAPGQAAGATFWDRSPVFLVTRHIDVTEHGAVAFHRSVLVPSEGAAVVLRVSKDGTGHAMLDELQLGP
jgi:hypothetical protein